MPVKQSALTVALGPAISPTFEEVRNEARANHTIGAGHWTITPQLAQQIMTELNQHNRAKQRDRVKEYSGCMLDESWLLTGDSLKFGGSYLLDGQNRLLACIESGMPFTSAVITGLDPRVFVAMDTGKARSTPDIFKIAGIDYYKDTAAAFSWFRYIVGTHPLTDRSTMAPMRALETYRVKCPTLHRSVATVKPYQKWLHAPIGLVAALHHEFKKANPKRAASFFEEWAEAAVNYSPTAANNTTVKKLVSEMESRHRALQNRDVLFPDKLRMLLIVEVWNAYVSSVPVTAEYLAKLDLKNKPAWPGIKG